MATLSASSANTQGKDAKASPQGWVVYIEDGKSGPQTLKDYQPRESLIGGYVEELRSITPFNVPSEIHDSWPSRHLDAWREEKFKAAFVGEWEAFQVYEITNPEAKHKGIVLRDERGKYWLLYAQFIFSTLDTNVSPDIYTVDGQSVLSYHVQLPGTGLFWTEYYWVYDKATKSPRLIDLSAINEAIRSTVPEGWGPRKGGGLDFPNLRYVTAIYDLIGPDYVPRIGRIEMKLSLDGARLSVETITYEPDYDWKH